MADPVRVTLYNDAGCPWGYSANPAFRVLEWRYGPQLEWRLVLIGLTNVAQEYIDRGYTPLRSAEGYARRFRRFGMPLAPSPRTRILVLVVPAERSWRCACRRRGEWAAFRALQFGFFTTTLLVDEDESLAAVLRGSRGSTLTRRSPRSTPRRWRRPTSVTGPRHAAPPARPPNCRTSTRPLMAPFGIRLVARVPARRAAPRGRWLANNRGLRRDRREPDPGRRAPRSAGRPTRPADRVPGRTHDPGGRTAPHARQ